MIPFGPFEPDKMETRGGIAMVAENVLPLPEGYGPFPGLSSVSGSTALSAAPRGLITVVLRAGDYKVYGFTESTLESLGTDFTWSTVDTGYSCTSGDDWSSVHFGNQLLYTNTTDGLYAYDLEAGGTPSSISAAGDPREVFTASNVVIGLDCLDRSSTRDNRLIRNSAFGDHTNWSTNGADYQPLEDGEELIAGKDLKNGAAVIFQKNAMRLMQFGNAGGGAVYSLQKIADGRGSVGARSVVSFDGVVYWLATNGFWKFSLGGGLVPIGSGKIDEWFFDHVDDSDLSGVQGSVDPTRKIVWWRWPSSSITSSEVFDDMIGYSWAYDRWVTAKVQTTYLSRIATPGYDLATADAAFSTLDGAPDLPVGDRFWQGGQATFAALDENRKYAPFGGDALAATIETHTINQPTSGLMSSLTPLTDADNGTVQVGIKDALKGDLKWKKAISIQPSGRCPVRARGKNMRFRLNVAAAESWTYAKGVDHFDATRGGPR